MARDKAYYEAEKIIIKLQGTGRQVVHLNYYGLTELPEILHQFRSIKELHLSKNQLHDDLPEWLGDLTQLRVLDLSSNSLKTLPKSLVNLKLLEHFDLGKNNLTSLSDNLSGLTQLRFLNLSNNNLTSLPASISQFDMLCELQVRNCQLAEIPSWIENLQNLNILDFAENSLEILPDSLFNLLKLSLLTIRDNQLKTISSLLGNLNKLKFLDLSNNQLISLPETLGQLINLETLNLSRNNLTDIPFSIIQIKKIKTQKSSKKSRKNRNLGISHNFSVDQLEELRRTLIESNTLNNLSNPFAQGVLFNIQDSEEIDPSRYGNLFLNLDKNPLNPELAEAYKQGINAVKAYMRAKAEAQITLNEAKLILVGEGEVGKTCLMDALLGNSWQEHDTTHGIAITRIKVTEPDIHEVITLNGWDFGGQRIYRPTHQLFFSAPAVYLVVWKPREGPQQGFVREWIQLIKRREPSAKIIVVATHGGPQQRQPDIDRQELWDLFGKETVIDFFFVDSKPGENGQRKGIEELKNAIARVAASLPEVGRSVPKRWEDVHKVLENTESTYLPLEQVLTICHEHEMEEDEARLFVIIEHRLGTLIHYQNDPTLRDIVILRPDWLATAMSYVLDDEETRKAHGLVKFSHLEQLWNDQSRPVETRYPEKLHRIFLRLMERFDLSYRVAGLSPNGDSDPQSLIAQLVPDNRPENMETGWPATSSVGDLQQTQICRIVDKQNGQSAPAEGLFYQLIVRLHKYSLGRVRYVESVHWQKGLVLENAYNGRAFLEHKGNDVHITVRAPYPERFLTMLTEEVKFLVESFWEGLRCDVMVPCLNPKPCLGLFEVEKLIENKKRGRPEQPCPICNEWQNIDQLLLNAPAARPAPTLAALSNQAVLNELSDLRQVLIGRTDTMMGRFDNLDASQRELLSKADASFNGLLRAFTDEAKEGPRLFSMRPVDPKWLEKPKQLVSQKFHILLWCEHSQLPLFVLNKEGDQHGIYELDLPYEWVRKAAPYLKALTATLSLILPVASSATKLLMDENAYKTIENQLAFGKDCFDSLLGGSEKVTDWVEKADSPDLPHGAVTRAEGALLRELQAFLKAKDPGFGGLVRVMNKRQEFLWVHPRFEKEY